ncbi:MAG: hypothetical protein LBQ28_10870, partial [Prevotellaceae bacterium]|nr:hypothetical protein [Prevotellaceae bacterium]
MKNLVVVEFRTFLPVGFVSAQTRLAQEITCIDTNQQTFFNELKTFSILGSAALNVLSLTAKFSQKALNIYLFVSRVCRMPLKVCRTPLKVCRTPLKVCRRTFRVCRKTFKVYRKTFRVCRTPLKVCRAPLKVCRAPLKACRAPLKVCRMPLKVCMKFIYFQIHKSISLTVLKSQNNEYTRLHPAI